MSYQIGIIPIAETTYLLTMYRPRDSKTYRIPIAVDYVRMIEIYWLLRRGNLFRIALLESTITWDIKGFK